MLLGFSFPQQRRYLAPHLPRAIIFVMILQLTVALLTGARPESVVPGTAFRASLAGLVGRFWSGTSNLQDDLAVESVTA